MTLELFCCGSLSKIIVISGCGVKEVAKAFEKNVRPFLLFLFLRPCLIFTGVGVDGTLASGGPVLRYIYYVLSRSLNFCRGRGSRPLASDEIHCCLFFDTFITFNQG